MRPTVARCLWVVIGVALLGLPFLSPGALGGFDTGPPWTDNVRAWMFGIVVVTAIGIAGGRLLRDSRIDVPRVERHAFLIALIAATTFLIAAAWLHVSVFASKPHLIDEMAQLFHARILVSGSLAAPPPDPAVGFLMMNTWVTDMGWISQYPPGHILLLAAGMAAGLEWMINPILGACSVLLVYAVGKGLYGAAVGMWAAILWTLSAWMLFTSSSYMNHGSAVTFALVAWACVFSPINPRSWHLTIAGLGLAAVASIRPLDAVAAAVPIGLWMIGKRRWSAVGWIGLGAVPIGILWALFNLGTVGDPFALGYTLLYEREHGLGFHIDPWGRAYTPAVALANAIAALRRLHLYAFEWPIPAMLPLGLWALLGRKRASRDLIVAAGILAAPFLYALYWHSGFFRGPRFYVLAAPFLFIAMARGWEVSGRFLRSKSRGSIRWDTALWIGGLTVVVWGAVGLLPQRARQYSESLAVLKRNPKVAAALAEADSALVLVRTSWGNRLVADFWALGVKPGLVERGYRRLDTCDLDQLRRAGLSGVSAEEMSRRLEDMLIESQGIVPRLADWPDPTVRLRDGSTDDARCADELRRDLEGFTIVEQLLATNDPSLRSGIVFARDIWERNDDLISRYLGWDVWAYGPEPGSATGVPVLKPLRRGTE